MIRPGWEDLGEGVERLYIEASGGNRGYLYRVRTVTVTKLIRQVGGSNESGMFPREAKEVGRSEVERVDVIFVPEAK